MIDWEAGALYRNLRRRGDDEATAVDKVREKFLVSYTWPREPDTKLDSTVKMNTGKTN